MPVQYIGSDPTWGPQQQVARRHAIEQTSVTLGLADGNPTVNDQDRQTRANPYHLRWRDSTYTAIGANQQWARRRSSTNTLGLADGDPTVKPPWADGSAYLWPAPRQPAAINATNAWARKRLSTNELGDASQSAGNIKPPWADGEAFYWPAPRQPDAINATNAWARLRLTTNDLGVTDADPTVKPNWQVPNPYKLWWRDPTMAAIEAVEQWVRTRLTSRDLGLTDADPTVTIRPRQDPYHLHRRDVRIPQRLLPFTPGVEVVLEHVTGGSFLLTEDGAYLLYEDGTRILLTDGAATEVVQHGGAKATVSDETRRYWESERQRLRIERDDEEILVCL